MTRGVEIVLPNGLAIGSPDADEPRIQDTQWGNSILLWGQAWENTVFIRVQWGWLGLLAGEIGLAIVFVCYTVYATH
jgi:hypothetical protein